MVAAVILTGDEFISEEDKQDLDGDGDATDPGWIHLAKIENKWGNGFSTDYDSSGPSYTSDLVLDIDDLLTLTLSCTDDLFGLCTGGYSWELATKVGIIGDVQSLLGDATFDHLAFSINSKSKFNKKYAVYDFDFTEIFEYENNPALNFSTPYVLSGTFNMNDFPLFHGVDYSPAHINVWARDPTDVPEPNYLSNFCIRYYGISVQTS